MTTRSESGDPIAAIQPAVSSDDASVRNVVIAQACAEFMRGAASSITLILPFVARRHFEASSMQVLILTVAVPVMQVFTIFWHRLFRNISTRSYIATIGATMTIPLVIMAFQSSLNWMIPLWLVAAFGGAGGGAALSPLNASVLRTRYPQAIRGRAFGIIGAFMFAGVMTGGYVIGRLSEYDFTTYRYYLPAAAMLMAAAMTIYRRIAPNRQRVGGWPGAINGWWRPLAESTALLKSDRNFRDYEAAYMSYGIGWMICTALLPFIGHDRLNLSDEHYSNATIVTFQAMMILLLFPAGRIADRIGPVRLVATSFLVLTIYPAFLIFVGTYHQLQFASALFAVGMVGVHLGWTLGPVHFAPDPDSAPQYLAIHGTLVGVRGIVFQGFGVLLYTLTGGAVIPLVIGGLGFVGAAWQMRRLGIRLGKFGT